MSKKIQLLLLSSFVLSAVLGNRVFASEPSTSAMQKVAYASHGAYDPGVYSQAPIQLNFAYPRSGKAAAAFVSSIKDPLTRDTIAQYVTELKAYIHDFAADYINKRGRSDFKALGWYQEPWIGAQREPILGVYPGNANSAGSFEGVNQNQAGYVLVAYDELAATVPGLAFDANGKLDENYAATFPEGAVIVKFAFSALNGEEWPAMKGAPLFNIMTKKSAQSTRFDQVSTVSLFQIDMVVRDTKRAPETGWMFSTLVYDNAISPEATDPLAQFVPLGGSWGNDPMNQLDTSKLITEDNPALKQNWINNKAPMYSRETLGVAGRLSGPNDGAVLVGAQTYSDATNKTIKATKVPMSSCMSCHSPAQNNMVSAIVPLDASGVVYNDKSQAFERHFRNLLDTAFDPGQKTYDFNMALAFKAIPAYRNYMSSHLLKPPTQLGKNAAQLSEVLSDAEKANAVVGQFEAFRKKY